MASCFLPLLVLLFLTVVVESRPSPRRDHKQVLHSLFGAHLSSLILAPPTSDDVTGGSGHVPASSSSSSRSAAHGGAAHGLAAHGGAAQGLAGQREKVPAFFLDFLRRQNKMRRRSRKTVAGGRGCFGMKMDRIGSISGLGC